MTEYTLKDPCRNRSVICNITKEAKEILQSFVEVAHELCQFGMRELSDVFVAKSILACMLAALVPACNCTCSINIIKSN